jgi:RNA polymerase sigma-70 factor (ECF subfamily)
MDEKQWLADQFEAHRGRLHAVAYRMLGSLAEADDAVQDSWLRVSRAETWEVENMRRWLTTIVARVCLNMLRARKIRREESLDFHVPDPILRIKSELEPEEQALMADSVGLALLVILDTLTPAERLAFVLHDMFAVSFEEIAPLVGRSAVAARQLASRARHRVKGGEAPQPDGHFARQQQVVDAFFSAARGGDFDALVAVLDPDIVLRIDGGAGFPAISTVINGSAAAASHARRGLQSWLNRPGTQLRPVLVNGGAGVIVELAGRPVTVMGFTIAGGKIVEIDAISDPERVARIAAGIVSRRVATCTRE